MISLTSRQKDILIYLCKQRQFVTINQLSNRFSISPRSIRNDLKHIDDFLDELKIDTFSQSNRGIKLLIDDNGRSSLRQLLNRIDCRYLSRFERARVIVILLLCNERMTYERFADICKVSRQTIINGFPETAGIIATAGLKLRRSQGIGISLAGNERTFRKAFETLIIEVAGDDLILDIIKDNSELFQYWVPAKDMIEDLERKLAIQFLEYEVVNLCLSYFLMRMANEHWLDDSEQRPAANLNPEQRRLHCLLEEYGFPAVEETYLCDLIINARFQNTRPTNAYQDDDANKIARYLFDRLEELQPLRPNDMETLVQGLSMHLRVAIYRIKNGIAIKNELLDQIKLSIPLIYEFTKKYLSELEKTYAVKFDENEIAYIAMYIASAYEKSVTPSSIKVLIVCSFGLATSAILKTRIIQTLPDCIVIGPLSKPEAENYLQNNQVDLIITTNECYFDQATCLAVNPLLTQDDVDFIKNKLFQLSYANLCKLFIKAYANSDRPGHCQVSDHLDLDDIMIDENCDDWTKAIRIASAPLLNKGFITQRYVERMIEAVKQYGPYMVLTPETAFIHAGTEDGINKNCASILVLRKPLLFGIRNQRMVRNIVVLGIKDKTDNSLLRLVNIFEKKTNIDLLGSPDISVEQVYHMHD